MVRITPSTAKPTAKKQKNKISEANSIGVAAYTAEDVLVLSFDSGVLAGEWCREQGLTKSKTPNSDIFKSCKEGRKAFGYYWKYVQ